MTLKTRLWRIYYKLFTHYFDEITLKELMKDGKKLNKGDLK